ncbi:MAG: type II toxin-antitoxin system RelE/ParE family toxin [Gammaproteobacteria bacterium]|nr:type II toxin-antitoxin system RelE/ParE family toxin [Gammaproteobacteria bacterium]
MTLAVRFYRAAREEFTEAAVRYEAQRPDLGVQFIAEIERCLEVAASKPQICAPVYKSVRRIVARRFPYIVYFRLEADCIIVLSVFHGNRDPVQWRKRT